MTAKRYFFYDPRTRITTTIDDPQAHPGFKGWRVTKKGDGGRVIAKVPLVEFGGMQIEGKQLQATQRDGIQCTTSCKRATEPICLCSCGGKNHGIENVGLAEGAEPLDVVWAGK